MHSNHRNDAHVVDHTLGFERQNQGSAHVTPLSNQLVPGALTNASVLHPGFKGSRVSKPFLSPAPSTSQHKNPTPLRRGPSVLPSTVAPTHVLSFPTEEDGVMLPPISKRPSQQNLLNLQSLHTRPNRKRNASPGVPAPVPFSAQVQPFALGNSPFIAPMAIFGSQHAQAASSSPGLQSPPLQTPDRVAVAADHSSIYGGPASARAPKRFVRHVGGLRKGPSAAAAPASTPAAEAGSGEGEGIGEGGVAGVEEHVLPMSLFPAAAAAAPRISSASAALALATRATAAHASPQPQPAADLRLRSGRLSKQSFTSPARVPTHPPTRAPVLPPTRSVGLITVGSDLPHAPPPALAHVPIPASLAVSNAPRPAPTRAVRAHPHSTARSPSPARAPEPALRGHALLPSTAHSILTVASPAIPAPAKTKTSTSPPHPAPPTANTSETGASSVSSTETAAGTAEGAPARQALLAAWQSALREERDRERERLRASPAAPAPVPRTAANTETTAAAEDRTEPVNKAGVAKTDVIPATKTGTEVEGSAPAEASLPVSRATTVTQLPRQVLRAATRPSSAVHPSGLALASLSSTPSLGSSASFAALLPVSTPSAADASTASDLDSLIAAGEAYGVARPPSAAARTPTTVSVSASVTHPPTANSALIAAPVDAVHAPFSLTLPTHTSFSAPLSPPPSPPSAPQPAPSSPVPRPELVAVAAPLPKVSKGSLAALPAATAVPAPSSASSRADTPITPLVLPLGDLALAVHAHAHVASATSAATSLAEESVDALGDMPTRLPGYALAAHASRDGPLSPPFACETPAIAPAVGPLSSPYTAVLPQTYTAAAAATDAEAEADAEAEVDAGMDVSASIDVDAPARAESVPAPFFPSPSASPSPLPVSLSAPSQGPSLAQIRAQLQAVINNELPPEPPATASDSSANAPAQHAQAAAEAEEAALDAHGAARAVAEQAQSVDAGVPSPRTWLPATWSALLDTAHLPAPTASQLCFTGVPVRVDVDALLLGADEDDDVLALASAVQSGLCALVHTLRDNAEQLRLNLAPRAAKPASARSRPRATTAPRTSLAPVSEDAVAVAAPEHSGPAARSMTSLFSAQRPASPLLLRQPVPSANTTLPAPALVEEALAHATYLSAAQACHDALQEGLVTVEDLSYAVLDARRCKRMRAALYDRMVGHAVGITPRGPSGAGGSRYGAQQLLDGAALAQQRLGGEHGDDDAVSVSTFLDHVALPMLPLPRDVLGRAEMHRRALMDRLAAAPVDEQEAILTADANATSDPATTSNSSGVAFHVPSVSLAAHSRARSRLDSAFAEADEDTLAADGLACIVAGSAVPGSPDSSCQSFASTTNTAPAPLLTPRPAVPLLTLPVPTLPSSESIACDGVTTTEGQVLRALPRLSPRSLLLALSRTDSALPAATPTPDPVLATLESDLPHGGFVAVGAGVTVTLPPIVPGQSPRRRRAVLARSVHEVLQAQGQAALLSGARQEEEADSLVVANAGGAQGMLLQQVLGCPALLAAVCDQPAEAPETDQPATDKGKKGKVAARRSGARAPMSPDSSSADTTGSDASGPSTPTRPRRAVFFGGDALPLDLDVDVDTQGSSTTPTGVFAVRSAALASHPLLRLCARVGAHFPPALASAVSAMVDNDKRARKLFTPLAFLFLSPAATTAPQPADRALAYALNKLTAATYAAATAPGHTSLGAYFLPAALPAAHAPVLLSAPAPPRAATPPAPTASAPRTGRRASVPSLPSSRRGSLASAGTIDGADPAASLLSLCAPASPACVVGDGFSLAYLSTDTAPPAETTILPSRALSRPPSAFTPNPPRRTSSLAWSSIVAAAQAGFNAVSLPGVAQPLPAAMASLLLPRAAGVSACALEGDALASELDVSFLKACADHAVARHSLHALLTAPAHALADRDRRALAAAFALLYAPTPAAASLAPLTTAPHTLSVFNAYTNASPAPSSSSSSASNPMALPNPSQGHYIPPVPYSVPVTARVVQALLLLQSVADHVQRAADEAVAATAAAAPVGSLLAVEDRDSHRSSFTDRADASFGSSCSTSSLLASVRAKVADAASAYSRLLAPALPHVFKLAPPRVLTPPPPPPADTLPMDLSQAFTTALTLQEGPARDASLLLLHDMLSHAAVGGARVLVREMYMSPAARTVRKAPADLYGGAKHYVRDGVVLRRAADPLVQRQPVAFMFGGATPADDLAAKAMGQELHALAAAHRFASARQLPLLVPPTVLVDFCGHRVLATPALSQQTFRGPVPVDTARDDHSDAQLLQLVYGSADNGVHIANDDPVLAQLAADVAGWLHLAPHVLHGTASARAVVLHTAGDAQGYRVTTPEAESVAADLSALVQTRTLANSNRNRDRESMSLAMSGDTPRTTQLQSTAPPRAFAFVLHSLARLLPPESPLFTKHLPPLAQAVFARHLRAEALAHLRTVTAPISSDALTAWGKAAHQLHNSLAHRATKCVLARAKALAQHMDRMHAASTPRPSRLAAHLLEQRPHVNPLVVLRHLIAAACAGAHPALQRAIRKHYLHAFRHLYHYFGPRAMATHATSATLPVSHRGEGPVAAVNIDWAVLDDVLIDYGDAGVDALAGQACGVTAQTYTRHVQAMLDYWAGVFAREGMSLPEFTHTWTQPWLASVNVSQLFHAWGIPLRHMEVVRQHAHAPAVRTKLLAEMLVRSAKSLWRERVRKGMRQAHALLKQEYKDAVQQARSVGAAPPKPPTTAQEATRAELVLQEVSLSASATLLSQWLLAFGPRPSPHFSSLPNAHASSAQAEAVASAMTSHAGARAAHTAVMMLNVPAPVGLPTPATSLSSTHGTPALSVSAPSSRHHVISATAAPTRVLARSHSAQALFPNANAQPKSFSDALPTLHTALSSVAHALRTAAPAYSVNTACAARLHALGTSGRPVPPPDYAALRQAWRDSAAFWAQTLPQRLQNKYGSVSLGTVGEALCAVLVPAVDVMTGALLAATGIELGEQKLQRVRVAVSAVQQHARTQALRNKKKYMWRTLTSAKAALDANDALSPAEPDAGNATVITVNGAAGSVSRVTLAPWLRGVYWTAEVDALDDDDSDAEDDDGSLDDPAGCECGAVPCVCGATQPRTPVPSAPPSTTAASGSASTPATPSFQPAPTPSFRRRAPQPEDRENVALLSAAVLLHCQPGELAPVRARVKHMPHVTFLRAAVTLAHAACANERVLAAQLLGHDLTSSALTQGSLLTSTTTAAKAGLRGYGSSGSSAATATPTVSELSLPPLASVPLLPLYASAPPTNNAPRATTGPADLIASTQPVSSAIFTSALASTAASMLSSLWASRRLRREATACWLQRLLDALYALQVDAFAVHAPEGAPLRYTAIRALLTAQQALYAVPAAAYTPALTGPLATYALTHLHQLHAALPTLHAQVSARVHSVPAHVLAAVLLPRTWPAPPVPEQGYLRGLVQAFIAFVDALLPALESQLVSQLTSAYESIRTANQRATAHPGDVRPVPAMVLWRRALTALPFASLPTHAHEAPHALRLVLACPPIVDRLLPLLLAHAARLSTEHALAHRATSAVPHTTAGVFTNTPLAASDAGAADLSSRFALRSFEPPQQVHQFAPAMSARTPSPVRGLLRTNSALPNLEHEAPHHAPGTTSPYPHCLCDLPCCGAEPSPAHAVLQSLAPCVLLPKLLVDWFAADPNHRDSLCAGRTALHVAARAGLACTVRLLVQRGALVDIPDYLGRTPVMLAAAAGVPGAVRALVRASASLAGTDKCGRGALHLAVQAEARMQALMEVCAHVGSELGSWLDSTRERRSGEAVDAVPESILACVQRHYRAGVGACAEGVDDDGLLLQLRVFANVVAQAMREGSASRLQALAQHCRQPLEVLHRAATAEARADLHETDLAAMPSAARMCVALAQPAPAFSATASLGRSSSSATLLSMDTGFDDVTLSPRQARRRHRRHSSLYADAPNSPLSALMGALPVQALPPHPACVFASRALAAASCVSLLVDYGADPHQQCLRGETPLFVAARHGSWRLLSRLAAHIDSAHATLMPPTAAGVDLDHRDVHGCTPLMAALAYPPALDTGLPIPVAAQVTIDPNAAPTSVTETGTGSASSGATRGRRTSLAGVDSNMLSTMAAHVNIDRQRRRSASRGRRGSVDASAAEAARRSATGGRRKSVDAGRSRRGSVVDAAVASAVAGGEVVSLIQLELQTPESESTAKNSSKESAALTALPALPPLPYNRHHTRSLCVSLLVALGADIRAMDAAGFAVAEYAHCVDAVSGRAGQRCAYAERAAALRAEACGEETSADALDATSAPAAASSAADIDVESCACPWCAKPDVRSPAHNLHAMTGQQAVARGLKWRRQRVLQIDSALAVHMNTQAQTRDTPFLIIKRRAPLEEAKNGEEERSAAQAPEPAPQKSGRRSRRDEFSAAGEAVQAAAPSVRSPQRDRQGSLSRLAVETKKLSSPPRAPPANLDTVKRAKGKAGDVRRLVLEYLYAPEDILMAFNASKARGTAPSPVNATSGFSLQMPSTRVSVTAPSPTQAPTPATTAAPAAPAARMAANRRPRGLYSDAFL